MPGPPAKWRSARLRSRNCLSVTRFGNIETNSSPIPGSKRPCSNATGRARSVTGLWLKKNFARTCKGKNGCRAIRFRRDNEKHCRVAGADADDRVLRLVADTLDSAARGVDAADGSGRAVYFGGSRSWPWWTGDRKSVV